MARVGMIVDRFDFGTSKLIEGLKEARKAIDKLGIAAQAALPKRRRGDRHVRRGQLTWEFPK